MVHLLGLGKGAHEGDCNLLINQWITAGSAGVEGSHMGQMPISVGSFSDREHPPASCSLLGTAGSFGDPFQSPRGRTAFGVTKTVRLRCNCCWQRLNF